MVTEGTVDEDIYKIQERKARMNDAIMEEEGRNGKKKLNDNDEMCRLANAAVERYLKSPTSRKMSEWAGKNEKGGSPKGEISTVQLFQFINKY